MVGSRSRPLSKSVESGLDESKVVEACDAHRGLEDEGSQLARVELSYRDEVGQVEWNLEHQGLPVLVGGVDVDGEDDKGMVLEVIISAHQSDDESQLLIGGFDGEQCEGSVE